MGRLCTARAKRLRKKFLGKPCGICGKQINGEITIDHIIPLSKGGSSAPKNLQPAHRNCNLTKGDSVPPDYIVPKKKIEELPPLDPNRKNLLLYAPGEITP